MVYPTLNISSIKYRCENDLIHFYELYNIKPNNKILKDINEISLYSKNKPDIKSMQKSIDNKIKLLLDISNIEEIIDFDYRSNIMNVNVDKQKQLWIIRTYIFYELLIFLSITLNNKEIYNEFYNDIGKGTENDNIYNFRKDISSELHNFKLGIYGSLTPTSDIDIGIQYSGITLKIPGLAYVVSRFEYLFIKFTKLNSLKWDIETYADMITIPSQLVANHYSWKSSNIDYFYLDTSNFEKEHFQKILICIGTSILRNVILSETDMDGKTLSKEKIKKVLDEFNMNKIFAINSTFKEFYKQIEDSMTNNWLKQAKKIVLDYMTSDYDEGRYKYYKKVNIAEKSKFKGTSNISNLDSKKICEIIKNIGISLSYRMESYTCSPTVIHIVRILQASKENSEKYKTLTPHTYCVGKIAYLDPYCSLTKYGYAISCLEQLGYIYRFHNLYCRKQSSYNKKKCNKKMMKYMKRYKNGIFYFQKYVNRLNYMSSNNYKRKRYTKKKLVNFQ